ncbi:MAG TPA: hypothetical protein VNO22_06215 [Planctomycetota bacterium]|nr:hypothetical protein [Planctomycetota bacterium]
MTRTRGLAVLGFLLAGVPAAWAQDDALTPTDVLEAGQFSATARLQFLSGQGDVRNDPVFEADFEEQTFEALLGVAVGIGAGLEVELSIPYRFRGTLEGDGEALGVSFESEEESLGFGDLQISPVLRLLREDASSPQLIVGAIAVAPTGNDKRGDPELEVGGSSVSEGEEGGIGQGVWKFGGLAGISKNLGLVEPYLVVSYLWGGERERNDVDEERADLWTILAGAEWHLSPTMRLDTRALFFFVGEDVTEESGSEAIEEAHFRFGFEASVYAKLGGGFTLTLGGGVLFVEDHTIDEVDEEDLENAFQWNLGVGLHFFFGG